jgi:hypothetical protein
VKGQRTAAGGAGIRIERGVKRRCGTCEAPFYDMLRYPIRCPKCGAAFVVAATAARKSPARGRPKARTAGIRRQEKATDAGKAADLEKDGEEDDAEAEEEQEEKEE